MTDTLCQIFNERRCFFVVCFWCQWMFCHARSQKGTLLLEKFLFWLRFLSPGQTAGYFRLSLERKLHFTLSLRRSASERRPISLFWYTYIAHKYDVTFLYDAHGAFIILFSRSLVWLSPSRTKNSKVASIFPRRRRRMPLTKIAGW